MFAFTGETGRLLRPLALTKTLVIAAAALVTLTARAGAARSPAARAGRSPSSTTRSRAALVRIYRPFVHFALARPALTLATAGLALVSRASRSSRGSAASSCRASTRATLLYMPTTRPGVPPEQAALQLFWQDFAMSQFGEVATVFGKVGRADTGTDPAPYSMAETTIRLRPRAEWPKVPRARWYSGWAPAPLRAGAARRLARRDAAKPPPS